MRYSETRFQFPYAAANGAFCYSLRNKTLGQALALIALLALSSPVRAETVAQLGTLKVGPDARSAGMGNAVSAIKGNPSGFFLNPAAPASQQESVSVNLTQVMWLQEIKYSAASISARIGWLGTFSAGGQMMDYGSMGSLDNTGVLDGSFHPKETVITAGWSRRFFDFLAVGVSGKSISSKISSTARSTAIDAGFQASYGSFTAGGAVQNVGKDIKYNLESEALPRIYRGGLAFSSGKITLAAEAVSEKGRDAYFAGGAEYLLDNFSETDIVLRGGYTTESRKSGKFNGITGGAGIVQSGWRFDYACAPVGELGTTHRFTFALRIGTPRPAVSAPVSEADLGKAIGADTSAEDIRKLKDRRAETEKTLRSLRGDVEPAPEKSDPQLEMDTLKKRSAEAEESIKEIKGEDSAAPIPAEGLKTPALVPPEMLPEGWKGK